MTDIYVSKTTEIAARMLGGEMMIMSARDSTLFTLNEIGTAIWEGADGVTPLREIVERRICAGFEVDSGQALADAQEFVSQLAQHGLLIVSEEPAVRPQHTMGSLMQEMGQRALDLGVPLSVQLDLTYRCNERCVHCYLDHDDHGEMTTAEIKALLNELAESGVFFLILSGGEILMRRDFFEIFEHARRLLFSVKLKTNAVMIRESEADRIHALAPDSVQISIYSHRPEVHDAITKLPGSLKKPIAGARLLVERGIRVIFANVLMRQNFKDYPGMRALAQEVGAQFTIDPTITPMMDGDRSTLSLNIDEEELRQVFRDPALTPPVEEACAPPAAPDQDVLDDLPCSAGHTACYVSPYGDVYPCVQFPLPSGSVRRQKFIDIWNYSPQLNEVRSIHLRDLTSCSSCTHVGGCTRCPGLAYMEGNMRGPSVQDCEKSFARTGVPSVNLQNKKSSLAGLIQISVPAALQAA